MSDCQEALTIKPPWIQNWMCTYIVAGKLWQKGELLYELWSLLDLEFWWKGPSSMKLSSKRATVLNSPSYFLDGFHILLSLLQSKQLLWQSYLPAVHSLCDHSYPHRRHLGLHFLLDESASICLHHWNEILLISAELLGLWFKWWEKGRISHRAAYTIIRSCIHSTQWEKSEEGEMRGQLSVPAPTSCPGVSPTMLQKNPPHRFRAPSAV